MPIFTCFWSFIFVFCPFSLVFWVVFTFYIRLYRLKDAYLHFLIIFTLLRSDILLNRTLLFIGFNLESKFSFKNVLFCLKRVHKICLLLDFRLFLLRLKLFKAFLHLFYKFCTIISCGFNCFTWNKAKTFLKIRLLGWHIEFWVKKWSCFIYYTKCLCIFAFLGGFFWTKISF